jgi:hypothetical protein
VAAHTEQCSLQGNEHEGVKPACVEQPIEEQPYNPFYLAHVLPFNYYREKAYSHDVINNGK